MSKGLPIEVVLRRMSSQNNVHSVLFKLIDEYWQLEGASVQSNYITITRCPTHLLERMKACPDSVVPMVPGRYGVDTYGRACPIKVSFSKANLLRYIRQDPRRHLLGLRKKLKIAVLNSGRMKVVAGTKEAHIFFNEQMRVPVWISRAVIYRRRRKLSVYQGREFLLDVYGTLLRRLDDVVARVMQDTTVFVDPLEMKMRGNRQHIVLRW